jgi:activator of HSP90 ATPase
LAQKECIHFYQDVEKMKVIHMHWRMCQWDNTNSINRSFVHKAKDEQHAIIAT